MHEATFHTLIGKALTEQRFRNELLLSPRHATRGLSLSSEEKAIIGSVEALSLEEFARQIRDQLAVAQS